jgi:hypothetical protein
MFARVRGCLSARVPHLMDWTLLTFSVAAVVGVTLGIR